MEISRFQHEHPNGPYSTEGIVDPGYESKARKLVVSKVCLKMKRTNKKIKVGQHRYDERNSEIPIV